MTPRKRLWLACLLFSSWLILLLTGFVFSGLVHLALAAALVVFPWKVAAGKTPSPRPERGTLEAADDGAES